MPWTDFTLHTATTDATIYDEETWALTIRCMAMFSTAGTLPTEEGKAKLLSRARMRQESGAWVADTTVSEGETLWTWMGARGMPR